MSTWDYKRGFTVCLLGGYFVFLMESNSEFEIRESDYLSLIYLRLCKFSENSRQSCRFFFLVLLVITLSCIYGTSRHYCIHTPKPLFKLTSFKYTGRFSQKEDLPDIMVAIQRRPLAGEDLLSRLRSQQTRDQRIPHQNRIPIHEGQTGGEG